MVPEIGDLISSCFYEGNLKSAEGQRSQWLSHVFEKPVVWYTTSRQEGRFETIVGTSRSNNLEARQVRDLLDRLNFAATHAGEALSVAVLSGYLAQLTTIERQIADRRDGWTSLNVHCSSIDAFQGRQCDVLIYSVTRSNPAGKLGFLREERRLNVALSRGRQGLVLVGDHLFARSAGDVGNPFRGVIDFIDEHPSSCALVEVEA
jgi:superfamily I DNA and/or RNA helicase